MRRNRRLAYWAVAGAGAPPERWSIIGRYSRNPEIRKKIVTPMLRCASSLPGTEVPNAPPISAE
jgi:hypothetical protein